MTETIKVYETSDVGASQSLVTLEGFIGDMDNAELADDSTVDTSEAVIAINGLIHSLEQRDAENERLRALLSEAAPYVDRARISHLGTDAIVAAHNKRCLDLLERMRALEQKEPVKCSVCNDTRVLVEDGGCYGCDIVCKGCDGLGNRRIRGGTRPCIFCTNLRS